MSGQLSPAEQDAIVRFRPGQKTGHVESNFIKLNLPGGRALWLKLTVLKRSVGRADTVAEAWAIAFNLAEQPERHVALKQTWPFTEATIEQSCFFFKVGEVTWRHGASAGSLQDPRTGERITWDLTFRTDLEGHRHLPYAWMYRGAVPKTKPMSPQIDTRFNGWVRVDDHETKVSNAPGMLGHNWGTQQAESWTWVHCNMWDEGDQDLVFEGITSRVKMGPITSPQISVLHARVRGERVDISGLTHLLRIRTAPDGLSWRFEGTRGDRRIAGYFSAVPERFVGVNYHDPDDRIVHCLNTKIADGEVTVSAREGGRWRPLAHAVARSSAALEVGVRGQSHGVRIYIV